MGRTESKQAFQQSSAQSTQDQANAQSALSSTNASVGKYNQNLNDFLRFGNEEYGPDGELARTTNTINTTAAAAGSKNLGQQLALRAMRTGENTAGYAPAAAEEQRQASRDVASTLADNNSKRIAALTAVNQYGVDASKVPAELYGSLYGTSTGGANAAMGNATTAARMPGFWDTFAPALAQGAGTAIAGACPCAGAMIRMADGSRKPVEQLLKGEFVWPLSTSAPPNPVLETPQPVRAHCFEITSRTGLKHAASESHTIALAIGGYGFMPELCGQVVLAGLRTDEVIEVNDIGEQMVYPVKLGGSHTYEADGIWVMS